MPFSEWLKWRAGSGKRPTRGRDGVSTTMQLEAVLWKALMSAFTTVKNKERRPSPALSELSGEPGVEELQAVLQKSYDPRKEDLEAFEARINRAAEGLQMLGIEVAERQEEVLLKASAIKEVYGAIPPLFSTPSLGKGEGGGPAVSAGRPRAEESERLRRKVLKEQTEVLKQAFSAKPGIHLDHYTVKTDLHWSTLSDDLTDVKDVAEFYEAFEDNCGLANNCQGMSKREMLVALRSRCRGSRLKTFQNIYRQEFKSGTVGTDPEAVYEKIKTKHLLFSESVEEREIRVDSEHAALMKGKLTGHQFEPLFERLTAFINPKKAKVL
eukprot:symbB.v1.2.035607.t1/scaffold4832.1/size34166/4